MDIWEVNIILHGMLSNCVYIGTGFDIGIEISIVM